MGLNRYAKARDENEPEIIEALRKNGAVVYQDLPLDLLVGINGKWFVIEAKMPNGRLTERQERVFDELDRAGMLSVTTIVRYPAEALSFIGIENRGVDIGQRVAAFATSPWLDGRGTE